jgi:hypothetical protein
MKTHHAAAMIDRLYATWKYIMLPLTDKIYSIKIHHASLDRLYTTCKTSWFNWLNRYHMNMDQDSIDQLQMTIPREIASCFYQLTTHSLTNIRSNSLSMAWKYILLQMTNYIPHENTLCFNCLTRYTAWKYIILQLTD